MDGTLDAGTMFGSGEGTAGLTPFTLAMLERTLAAKDERSAVERFAEAHETHDTPADGRYSALLPASPPRPGQQYAFEVNLDVCTGCKSCVVACHSQNGLDEGESFRSVGFLHGGSDVAPYQQTVTTACHHCLDPACASGCPVLAYEKDPVTGVVHHLDDQCIGCQYCVFTCPYEVPRFNASLGIVRKCDMCRDRLAADEAPACVAACPNGAIAIRVVDVQAIEDAAEVSTLVPGAPSSSITRPTTTYVSRSQAPSNALPADFHRVRPSANHAPLVIMLVLTQLSVGAFAAQKLLENVLSGTSRAAFEAVHAPFALAMGLLSLGASVLHLGRPQGAYRAVLGLRRSWLSREIVAFGGFAAAAMLHAALAVPALAHRAPAWLLGLHTPLELAVVGLGLAGVLCSAMLYHVTGRAFWRVWTSLPRFLGTAIVLGAASAHLVLVATGGAALPALRSDLTWLVGVAAMAKLVFELSVLVHTTDRTHTELRRTATLLRGPLANLLLARVVAAVMGGVLVPLIFYRESPTPAAALVGVVMSLGILLTGELVERTLFFRAQTSPRMPGGLA